MKPKSSRRPTIRVNSDVALATRVCWHHFKEGLTQQETADQVGISRASVNKIISDARASGLVRIEIDNRFSPYLDLEQKLIEAYGLQKAIVVPAPAKEEDSYLVVGLATGDYISTTLLPNSVLGISWGSTLHFAARSLRPRSGTNNIVVSLSGGLPRSMIINPYDNAANFARALDAECYYITAPLMVEESHLKEALLHSASLRTVLDVARKIDLAVLTVTDLTANSRIMKHGVLTEEMRISLLASNSVGSVCDHYIDPEGNIIDHPLNDRTIAVPIDIVRDVPMRVLAGGGIFKVDVLRACLRANLCNVLITEEHAAKALLRSG